MNFATSNERILQRVTSDFLQRATSDFLQRATSATSNDRILQRITSDFTTSNEQRVKSYASSKLHFRSVKGIKDINFLFQFMGMLFLAVRIVKYKKT